MPSIEGILVSLAAGFFGSLIVWAFVDAARRKKHEQGQDEDE